MSTIGFFGIEGNTEYSQHDRSHLPKLSEMVGAHHIKVSLAGDEGVEYFSTFASKAKAAKLDSVICTDSSLLWHILKSLPDFKQSYLKNGSPRKPTLNDYHGSLVTLDGFRLGRDEPLDVLFLNPLQHLRTVPEAPYVFKRFISKITKPEKWFPQTPFTWEVATEETVESLWEAFKSALLIACDIETDEDSPHRTINCSGYCALFPDGTTHSVVIPTTTMWGVRWMRRFNQLPAPKVFQNGLYDNLYYLRYNSPVHNWLYDTQNLFHSWFSELPKRLDFITAFALRKVRFWKDDGKSGGILGHYEYNARDVWATLNSWLSMLNECPEYARTNYVEEFPMNFPCLHVEADGMPVDKNEFEKAKESVIEKLRPLEEKLKKWVHPNFNPGSRPSKRLLKVLGCADKHGVVKSSMKQH
jgi:hypothetical protein